ncbi:MAG: benzoate/H(+) symporter BenE family transporter [Thermomicrobiales bacterium]|nr:benzoate/H(+) symporter BenE family transporter [Thermomicrobiales bacterium]
MFRSVSIEAIAPTPARPKRALLADINSENVAAGMTTGLFYAFGAIPVHLDAMSSLRLDASSASSWFFITFMTSAISSLILSLVFRMPLPVGWTMPGLIFLASSADHFTHAEMTGAVIATGIATIALGFLGIGERLMRWLPLPIVMGMFAGNVLSYVTGIFRQLEVQPTVVGATILGYLAARAARRVWCPPIVGSVVAGIGVAAITGQVQPSSFQWSAPIIEPVLPRFDPGSMLSLSVPLLVMATGIGNVQGFGVLSAQGYRPPVRLLTVWMGVTTLVNAAFGGHVSAIQHSGAALLGGAEAGPRDQRYMASVSASILAILLGLCAATAGTVMGILPPGLVPAIAGLALLTSLVDALGKTTRGDLTTGASFAFVIAASGVTLLGIGAPFWALIGGLGVSLILEHASLRTIWRAA